jgi:hypothetical protein
VYPEVFTTNPAVIAMEFEFEIYTTGRLEDDSIAALIDAGCEDAGLIRLPGGGTKFMFGRQAPTLGEAVVSAIRDIQRAKVGFRVLRVEPAEAAAAALEYAGQQALAAS